MKNFEKYEKEIKKIGICNIAYTNGELKLCRDANCTDCIFNRGEGGDCNTFDITRWLYEEYQKPKIKIPLATKVILESLNDRWEWIAKDKDNCVVSFENKPTKGIKIWNDKKMMGRTLSRLNYTFKNDLFDFLSWEDEEPTNIRELLENCEVINDE